MDAARPRKRGLAQAGLTGFRGSKLNGSKSQDKVGTDTVSKNVLLYRPPDARTGMFQCPGGSTWAARSVEYGRVVQTNKKRPEFSYSCAFSSGKHHHD
jgi:hypothetical protein